MKNKDKLSPINVIFWVIAFSPYLAAKFGIAPIVLLLFIILLLGKKSYHYYHKKAQEENISFQQALQKDLPDMSPIHFLFFFVIAAPIFIIFTGAKLAYLYGIGALFVLYTIYYYIFKQD